MLRLTWGTFAGAVLLAVVMALLIVMLVRLRNVEHLTEGIQQTQQSHVKFHIEAQTRETIIDQRLTSLEREVFGTPPPVTTKVLVTPAWRKNRDQELRRRLSALEEWRLRTESR